MSSRKPAAGKRNARPHRVMMLLRSPNRKYLLAIAVLIHSLALAHVPAIQPLHSFNHSPFVQIYGLPAPQSGEVLSRGHVAYRVTVDMANSCTYFNSTTENFWMDGETTSLNFSSRIGLGHGLELRASLSHITHSAGILDDAIKHWHALTGLPQGRRASVASNRFLYRYTSKDRVHFVLDKPVAGFGDLLLLEGWQIRQDFPVVTVRAGLKLPTGRAASLLGSGAADELLLFSTGGDFRVEGLSLEYVATRGGIRMGPSLLFHDVQRRFVAFGNAGIGLHLWHGSLFLCQFDAHSPFYHSHLYQLGLPSIEMSLGELFRLPRRFALEIGLSEDVAVGTAADVDFNCSIQKTF